jgi:hypothetical protein
LPEFHLNPTITLDCPLCRHPVTLPLMGGVHALICEKCQEKMTFQLPREPCEKIQALCHEMEERITGFILGPAGARMTRPESDPK